MVENSKFKKDISRGKNGEEIVKRFLVHKYSQENVLDVTDNRAYQDIDVDFVLTKDAKEMLIEVKYDSLMHITNNFPYEYYSNKSIKSIGCMEKTKSDFIFFISDKTYDCYIIKTQSIKEIVNKKIENNLLRWVNMGDNAYGVLVPLGQLDTYGIKYKKINLSKFKS